MVSMLTHTKVNQPDWFIEPSFSSQLNSSLPSLDRWSVNWFRENSNSNITIGEFLFSRHGVEGVLASYLVLDDQDPTPRDLLIQDMLRQAGDFVEESDAR